MKDPPTHQPTPSGRTVTNDFTFHAIDLQLSNMRPLVCMCVWLLVGVSPCGCGCLGVCPHVVVAAWGCVPMWLWLLGGVFPCGCGCLWVCPHVDVAAWGGVPMWMWLLVGVSPCGRGCKWVRLCGSDCACVHAGVCCMWGCTSMCHNVA